MYYIKGVVPFLVMANSRISDLNKISSLDPSNDVQGSGMFLVANKKVGCEHIEYRDLKKSINDHTVFTTGNQDGGDLPAIGGNKTFNGTVTFLGGVVNGADGSPLSDVIDNLWQTGQDLNTLINANIGDIGTNVASAEALTSNLFQTGQTLNTSINQKESELDARITANDTEIDSLTSELFQTGQDLFSKIDTHSTLHEVATLTATQGITAPVTSGDLIQARTDKITVSGKNVFVSGENALEINSFNNVSINPLETLSTTSNDASFSAATKINLSSPVVTIGEDVFIKGDLFVSGETVTLDVGKLAIEDKTIELGVSTTGSDGTSSSAGTSDATADGGGIIVKSSEGDKSLLWEQSTASWVSNQAVSAEGSLTIKNSTVPPETPDAVEGNLGEIRWDSNFLYLKTDLGWRRALLESWS